MMIARVFLALAALLTLTLLLGCTGGGGGGVSITITPSTTTIACSQSLPFTAIVTGAVNTDVLWRVVGVGTSGSASITQAGVFSSAFVGRYRVIATSVADPSKSAAAEVTTVQAPFLTVTPNTVTIGVGDTTTFTATLVGLPDPRVVWTVTGGTISTTGANTATYTAPTTTGAYQVVAASAVDSTITATVQVLVKPRVTVSATSATLTIGDTLHLTAQTLGGANPAVTWSVLEPGYASTLSHVTNAAADFTAPTTPGTYHILATSAADSTVVTTIVITIQAGSAQGTIQ